MNKVEAIIHDAIKETPYGATTETMVEGIIEMLDLQNFVIVPKEPTRLMWVAGGDSIVQSAHARSINLHHDEVIKLVWYPMIAEAKRQPDVSEVEND